MLAPTHPAHLVFGLGVWSAWFVVLYGGLSVGCAVSPPAVESGPFNWLNGTLALVTAVTVLWLAGLMRRCWSARAQTELKRWQRFISTVSVGLYAIAAVSTLFIGLPVIVLPPCV